MTGPTRPLAGAHKDVIRRDELSLADRWIIARCDATVRAATESYERFRLNDAAAAVHHFLWSDLADWYIEQVKPRLYGDQPGGDVARAVLAQTFDVALRLLHPVMPFITETLWKRLPGRPEDASISVAPWPRPDDRAIDAEALTDFALVQQVVGAVRQIRAEYGVQPGQPVRLWVSNRHPALAAELGTIERLAKVSAIRFGAAPSEPGAHAVLEGGSSVFVPLGGALDLEKECGRLGAEESHLRQLVEGQRRKLDNAQFVARAPAAVVEGERQKLATWTEQADVLSEKRRILGCVA